MKYEKVLLSSNIKKNIEYMETKQSFGALNPGEKKEINIWLGKSLPAGCIPIALMGFCLGASQSSQVELIKGIKVDKYNLIGSYFNIRLQNISDTVYNNSITVAYLVLKS